MPTKKRCQLCKKETNTFRHPLWKKSHCCSRCLAGRIACISCERVRSTQALTCADCRQLAPVEALHSLQLCVKEALNFLWSFLAIEFHPGLLKLQIDSYVQGVWRLGPGPRILYEESLPIEFLSCPLPAASCDGISYGICSTKTSKRTGGFVESIGIVPGLPQVRAIGTLCHELVHGWLFLTRITQLGQAKYKQRVVSNKCLEILEEGLCSWVSARYARETYGLVTNCKSHSFESRYLKFLIRLWSNKAAPFTQYLARSHGLESPASVLQKLVRGEV
eukprot:Protomagalhaensia_wolfi_Nauph_80__6348@NODE_996_length_1824_cov_43_058824_g753_i0_p1_GENE_NODE_996_length_1824_cov_43_058824_g753_i0NODE_996_length_1824_cov_43_058824_g753_i0_p1_ORF_typecomplete_len277_score5_22DA1like/PF12315_8/2_3e08SprTlike/PF10263_9/0_1NinF/PF05810_12/61NinF/PF05810_12/0_46_NODE_996_length_1824_cov_43_058824_g753_i02351065